MSKEIKEKKNIGGKNILKEKKKYERKFWKEERKYWMEERQKLSTEG